MRRFAFILVLLFVSCAPAAHSNHDRATAPASSRLIWPADLPVYNHIVIVVEENKDYEEIIGNGKASYINNVLKKEGASFVRMYGEEHFSQGNYFWMFSGDNQTIGFNDQVPSEENNPKYPFKTANLGSQLIAKGLSFKGYSESLPEIGFTGDKASAGLLCEKTCPMDQLCQRTERENSHNIVQSQIRGLSFRFHSL